MRIGAAGFSTAVVGIRNESTVARRPNRVCHKHPHQRVSIQSKESRSDPIDRSIRLCRSYFWLLIAPSGGARQYPSNFGVV